MLLWTSLWSLCPMRHSFIWLDVLFLMPNTCLLFYWFSMSGLEVSQERIQAMSRNRRWKRQHCRAIAGLGPIFDWCPIQGNFWHCDWVWSCISRRNCHATGSNPVGHLTWWWPFLSRCFSTAQFSRRVQRSHGTAGFHAQVEMTPSSYRRNPLMDCFLEFFELNFSEMEDIYCQYTFTKLPLA